jgi:hypothetical protein
MGDPYESRLVRFFATLVVAVPALALVGFLIWLRAVGWLSQGVPLWTAVGMSALLVLGIFAFVVLVWWVGRAARR